MLSLWLPSPAIERGSQWFHSFEAIHAQSHLSFCRFSRNLGKIRTVGSTKTKYNVYDPKMIKGLHMDELSRIFLVVSCFAPSLLLVYARFFLHEFFTTHQSSDQLNAKLFSASLLHFTEQRILFDAMFIIVLAWANSRNQFVCSWTFLFGCFCSIVIRIKIERQSRRLWLQLGPFWWNGWSRGQSEMGSDWKGKKRKPANCLLISCRMK